MSSFDDRYQNIFENQSISISTSCTGSVDIMSISPMRNVYEHGNALVTGDSFVCQFVGGHWKEERNERGGSKALPSTPPH